MFSTSKSSKYYGLAVASIGSVIMEDGTEIKLDNPNAVPLSFELKLNFDKFSSASFQCLDGTEYLRINKV